MSRLALPAAALLTLAATAAAGPYRDRRCRRLRPRLRASARRDRSCPGDGCGRAVRRAARRTGAVAGAAVVCRDDDRRRRFGMAGIGLPLVEIGDRLSVVVSRPGGRRRVTACRPRPRWRWPVLFALFHGHAHGAEMPESLSGLDYAAGFVLATALLHALGVGIGMAAGRLGHAFGERALPAARAA